MNFEMVFRACDQNDCQKVDLEEFKKFFKRIKVGILDSEVERFIYFINEDCKKDVT